MEDATESDDDTLEFEIEIVESSSSVSLASNSAAEPSSIQIECQKVDHQIIEQQQQQREEEEERGEEKKRNIENTEKINCKTTICESPETEQGSNKSEKINDDENNVAAIKIQLIEQAAVEKLEEESRECCKSTSIQEAILEESLPEKYESEQAETEIKALEHPEKTAYENSIIEQKQQQVKHEICEQNEKLEKEDGTLSSSGEDMQKGDTDDKQNMIYNLNGSNIDEVEHSNPQEGVVSSNETNATAIEIDAVIPDCPEGNIDDGFEVENVTQEIKIQSGDKNEQDQPQADIIDTKSNDEISSPLIVSNVGHVAVVDQGQKAISSVSAPVAHNEANESHSEPVTSIELVAAESELIKESNFPNGVNLGIKSVLVEKFTPNYTEEVEPIKRHLSPQADRRPSVLLEGHNILLEVVEHSTGDNEQQQQQQQKKEVEQQAIADKAQLKTTEQELSNITGLSFEQIKQQTNKRRVSFGGGISRSASNISITTTNFYEDLESEFDNEPAFERRQIEVKRNKDVRDEYELGEELGRGRFGTVRKCIDKSNGTKLAAKFVAMRRREDREDVEREIYIMSLLQHKRLLQLYDAFDNGLNEMCLVTELIEGGELFERIIDDDFDLTEKKAAIFMRQICQGVDYMHSQNIVHLDMKPENILCVSKTGNKIKLIDFGLARQLNLNDKLRVMFGTPDFAAPEVLAYDLVSFSTDMWSVGVICYVLLSGLSPFMGDNDIETMANVTKATYDFDDQAFEPISDLAKDFISKLLIREQDKRLKPSECLQHPWLQRGGFELEANIRSRRESMVINSNILQNMNINSDEKTTFSATTTNLEQQQQQQQQQNDNNGEAICLPVTPPLMLSLDKRNLKKYVVRRKWHKTVHAIMALGRMGANLK